MPPRVNVLRIAERVEFNSDAVIDTAVPEVAAVMERENVRIRAGPLNSKRETVASAAGAVRRRDSEFERGREARDELRSRRICASRLSDGQVCKAQHRAISSCRREIRRGAAVECDPGSAREACEADRARLRDLERCIRRSR